MDETEKAGIRADVAKLALPVLVERLGGSVKITEAELEALTERKVAVRADYIGGELFLALVDAPARPPVN
jgi:hypothetical protein